ncbi:alpha/beta fold hydrolase [Algicola sagamiensis]|uniref:alpha/beta fold hydrolase n=1 Tax=Algicola sagamiensis TaxID=163869 RepID=UPI0003821F74|nr:alpha/beta family hydrolase [Algicola sagamiensis]
MSDNPAEILVTEVSGKPKARLILAHGAGAGMSHPFMVELAQGLAQHQIEVIRFDFPYMQQMTQEGKRRPPNKQAILEAAFIEVIQANTDASTPLFIAGKSMGGRIATHLIQSEPCLAGCIVYGYPFHPPGKPEKLRIDHLQDVEQPMMILQGERDTFGKREEVNGYPISTRINIAYIPDGDHSFSPRKSSGLTQLENLKLATQHTNRWIDEVINV